MKQKNITRCILCFFMLLTPSVAMVHADQTSPPPYMLYQPLPQPDIHDNQPPSSRDDWVLQWTQAYGGYGHAQLAQPVGDLDQDGVNEIILGGYETNGICRIYSYDTNQHTYLEEYSWYVPGGSYHSPSGACVIDLDEDGDLEFCVSWSYSGADGVYAYTWDGSTLTTHDRYYGAGVDFIFDIYACDYDDDGHTEVLIANAPNMGTGPYHVTALGWNTQQNKFYAEAFWSCPNGADKECPMVWSGDVDNDGKTEVIADVSNGQSSTAGTWALNWNQGTLQWDAVPVWTNYPSSTVYGTGVGDINGDGIPEIGVGSYGGTPAGWLFQWDGNQYQQVWHQTYPSGQPSIESVAIGDADNDGYNEFCLGTGYIHVIGWDGTHYIEKATLTDPTGMLAGLIIGDCDSDGHNEIKACEILSGTGSEFIYKYLDTTPPTTTCELTGDLQGTVYISAVTITLTAEDTLSGVNRTMYKLDTGGYYEYTNPLTVNDEGKHTLYYYSVDNAGNFEDEHQTTFTIQRTAILSITGGIGVHVSIKNNGTDVVENIPWKISCSGGLIMYGKTRNGTISLAAGQETTLTSLLIGIGQPTLTITLGDLMQQKTVFVLGFLVIIKT